MVQCVPVEQGLRICTALGPSPGRTAFAGCTPAHLPTLLASFSEKLLHGDSLHKAEYSHRMKTYLDLGLVPILLMTGWGQDNPFIQTQRGSYDVTEQVLPFWENRKLHIWKFHILLTLLSCGRPWTLTLLRLIWRRFQLFLRLGIACFRGEPVVAILLSVSTIKLSSTLASLLQQFSIVLSPHQRRFFVK